jgi:hypothetical protein
MEKQKDGKTVKTTVTLDREIWKAVQHLAIERGASCQELVGEALKKFVGGGQGPGRKLQTAKKAGVEVKT